MKKENSKTTKVVLYLRFSSSNQNEQSIEGQRAVCQNYCQSKGYIILDEYIDRAMTGTNDKRPDFLRMIKDSERQTFSKVIVYKIDRFGRDRFDIAVYKKKLKQNGVLVESANENIPEGPEGIVLESLLEGLAEYYSAELSQKIKRGIRVSASKFKAISGQVPFGFLKDENGNYVINPELAPIVQEIFKRYADGEGSQKIADDLNNRGIKTSQGKLFGPKTIPKIITNVKYIGTYDFNHGELRVENAIPSIVDKELFTRCQIMLNSNKYTKHSEKIKEKYILSDKLYCGTCEEKMTGDSGTGKLGIVHRYYTCTNKKQKKGCNKKSVKKNDIELLVTKITYETVLQKSIIDKITEKIMEIQEKDVDKTVLISLQSQLKDVEKSLSNIISAIEQGIITPTTKERLLQLEQEKENILCGISREEYAIRKPKVDAQSVKNWLNSFKKGKIHDKKFQEKIIQTFVNKVIIYDDDKITIVYNYTDDNTISLSKDEIEKITKNPKNVAMSTFLRGSDSENKLETAVVEPASKMITSANLQA